MERINIAVAARNEEGSFEKLISSISKALKKGNLVSNLYICLNGNFDNSEDFLKKLKGIYECKFLKIKILSSSPGKLFAQDKIIRCLKSNKELIFFLDADIELDENSLLNIVNEFRRHPDLIVVGGFPVARRYDGLNMWKVFLDNILNIRSRHPKSEISVYDVSKYHSHAILDPQKINTDRDHELRSKIFFHGRIFCLKSKKYWRTSNNKKIVGDDSFLPDYIIHKYGPNRIRIRYDSIVYYCPYISIIEHYRTYKRIYFDLYNLKKYYPQFREIRNYSKLKLDWKYIRSQGIIVSINFSIFSIFRFIEGFLFKLSLERNPRDLWT